MIVIHLAVAIESKILPLKGRAWQPQPNLGPAAWLTFELISAA